MRAFTRPLVSLLVASVAAVTVGGGLGSPASAAGGTRGATGYQRALRADAARQARMAARGRPHAVGDTRRSPAHPGIFGSARNVERIARDAVQGGQANTQVEPDVAMDPNNPNNIVAVVQQGRFKTGGSADSGFAASLDGGATWTHGNLPGLTTRVGGPFDRSSDPSVVFGPDHTVYASTIDFSFGKKVCPSAVAVQSSTDGGITWGDPVFAENDRSCDVFNDKNWLGVDTNPASPHFGRLYLVWSYFTKTASPAVLRYSDDHGQTWSDLIYASSQDTESEGVLPLISSNGDLTLVYDQTVGGQDVEVAQTSTDGGLTFGPIVIIAQSLGAGDPGLRTGGLPAAAIDPTTDEQYVVWQDTRFRSDGLNDIVISASTDGGATWTDPALVNGPDPQGEELDHFTPDVAAYGGVVHVTYSTRDFAGKKPSGFVDEQYIVSASGGASFGGELALGPPIDLNYAATVTGGAKFLGDYAGVVANADEAHAVWCVARFEKNSRYNQTLWSATIDR